MGNCTVKGSVTICFMDRFFISLPWYLQQKNITFLGTKSTTWGVQTTVFVDINDFIYIFVCTIPAEFPEKYHHLEERSVTLYFDSPL